MNIQAAFSRTIRDKATTIVRTRSNASLKRSKSAAIARGEAIFGPVGA